MLSAFNLPQREFREVFDADAQGKVIKLSDNMALTIHINSPKLANLPVGDDAWKAFVAELQANSKSSMRHKSA